MWLWRVQHNPLITKSALGAKRSDR
uniref:Uncharacterized protein n=1 Tax=Anguilla anguilla TaxID=7936 RepID=A0A0E9Q866_ANGAN